MPRLRSFTWSGTESQVCEKECGSQFTRGAEVADNELAILLWQRDIQNHHGIILGKGEVKTGIAVLRGIDNEAALREPSVKVGAHLIFVRHNGAVSLRSQESKPITFGAVRPQHLMGVPSPEQDSGLHFHQLPSPLILLELPLAQSIGDDLRLIGECAEKVSVLYLAFSVDDNSDRDRVKGLRVKPMLGKGRVNPSNQVFIPGVIPDANRGSAPSGASCGIVFHWQLHLIHVQDQIRE